jgi:hypothetical protein
VRPQASTVVLVVVLALTLAAGGAVLISNFDPHPERSRDFQRLVGGLGFGPALDVSRCTNSFDPRLCPHSPAEYWPLPGGGCFCPEHACSVFDYPPLGAAP